MSDLVEIASMKGGEGMELLGQGLVRDRAGSEEETNPPAKKIKDGNPLPASPDSAASTRHPGSSSSAASSTGPSNHGCPGSLEADIAASDDKLPSQGDAGNPSAEDPESSGENDGDE